MEYIIGVVVGSLIVFIRMNYIVIEKQKVIDKYFDIINKMIEENKKLKNQ